MEPDGDINLPEHDDQRHAGSNQQHRDVSECEVAQIGEAEESRQATTASTIRERSSAMTLAAWRPRRNDFTGPLRWTPP